MIIKSMSRKKPNFRQLVAYFNKEQYSDAPSFTQNLWSNSHDHEGLVGEFEHNATFLPKRSNGNYMYHEVIALERNDEISRAAQTRILLDLAQQYVKLRAPQQMVYGKMHKEAGNLHFHLMISANGVAGKKRLWLSKAELGSVQRQVEDYKLEHYPELGQDRYYDKAGREQRRVKERQAEAVKINAREFELKRRTGQPSQKENLRETIKDIFETSLSESELHHRLSAAGYNLYVRGQTEGIEASSDGTRFRLRTLGLATVMQKTQSRLRVYAEREAELTLLRGRQAAERDEPDNERDR